MTGAIEEAVKHCTQREQFGRSLIKHGPVATLLADSWSDLESSRFLTYQTASLAIDDPAKILINPLLQNLPQQKLHVGSLTDVCRQWADGD
ncbi:MAG: hypothetical protein CM15mP49_06530 [Actinomycetota bacterium]|nr:MAG: hypothetical protein CM15mP49_06530 [Actinomycetota bacterium]